MLNGFFGRVSMAPQLKQALDLGSQRTRMIADRVAKATLQQGGDGFSIPQPGQAPGTTLEGSVDLESEMVSLADEQLHFEATSRLLEKTYQQIRTSLDANG
ncbi:MAG TPA: hypothetical protein VFL93_00670 [Longimicrobiaceae bacterium]|jgi:flagellar basal body rod protein FlgB|nr:hypothetical protein [Longimicrobiaceae bacterium]